MRCSTGIGQFKKSFGTDSYDATEWQASYSKRKKEEAGKRPKDLIVRERERIYIYWTDAQDVDNLWDTDI